MYKEERHKRILELLEEDTYVSAARLSRELFVSLPTVRRDLAQLQQQGLVLRSHGGAKRVADGHFTVPYLFRVGYKTEEKRALCREAVRLVKPGDVVFISDSTTLFPLCRLLAEVEGVTVVTNGINTAALLQKYGVNSHCTGGRIGETGNGCFGSETERFVGLFNFDIAFFSSHGISVEGGIVDTALPIVELLRCVIRNARAKVYVCDGDKLSQSGPYRAANTEDVDYIITNAPLAVPTPGPRVIVVD